MGMVRCSSTLWPTAVAARQFVVKRYVVGESSNRVALRLGKASGQASPRSLLRAPCSLRVHCTHHTWDKLAKDLHSDCEQLPL
jgi:hypothetical protein